MARDPKIPLPRDRNSSSYSILVSKLGFGKLAYVSFVFLKSKNSKNPVY